MRTTTLLAPVAIAALALVGCGDDDDADAAGSPTTDAATDATTTTAGGAEAGGDTIEVVAVNYAYEDLPDEVAAGTTLALRNDSDNEVHELIAYRLPDDEQRSAEELLALPEEEIGALLAGPPDLGLLALPGETGSSVVGDPMVAEPGRYHVFCAIPTGATVADVQAAIAEAQESDGPPPEIPGGPPHFTAGMYAEIQVS